MDAGNTDRIILADGAETLLRLGRGIGPIGAGESSWPGAPVVFAEKSDKFYAGLTLQGGFSESTISEIRSGLSSRLDVSLGSAGVVFQIPERLRLEEGRDISWEGYLTIENGLIEVLSTVQGPPVVPICAAEVYLGLLGRYIEAKQASDDLSLCSQAVSDFAAQMSENGFRRITDIAVKTIPSRGIRKTVSGLLETASICASKGRNPGKIALSIGTFARFLGRRNPETGWNRLGEEGRRDLLNYVIHYIRRKGLLIGRSPYFCGVVRRGFGYMLVLLGSILQRLDDGTDLGAAIRDTERSLSAVPPFSDRPHAQRIVNDSHFWLQIFDRYIHGKNFAKSMLSG